MNKEFVPYEQALALKELGFDESCFGVHYGKNDITLFSDCIWEERTNTRYLSYFEARDTFCTAITYQQVFRWFREKHNYFSSPTQSTKPSGTEYDWLITKQIDESRILIKTVGYFPTYEEAELECLKKLIELCKKN